MTPTAFSRTIMGTLSSEQRPSFFAMSGYMYSCSLVTSATIIGRRSCTARPLTLCPIFRFGFLR